MTVFYRNPFQECVKIWVDDPEKYPYHYDGIIIDGGLPNHIEPKKVGDDFFLTKAVCSIIYDTN
jgi:hypothetical protein